jgi:hypothetical protein
MPPSTPRRATKHFAALGPAVFPGPRLTPRRETMTLDTGFWGWPGDRVNSGNFPTNGDQTRIGNSPRLGTW